MNKKLTALVTRSGGESKHSKMEGESGEVLKFKKLKMKKMKDGNKGCIKGSDSDGHPTDSSLDMVLASLLWSIKASTDCLPSSLPPFLVPDHFKSSIKWSMKSSSSSLPLNHSFSPDIVLPLPSVLKVKEYAPLVFASLRDKVYGYGTRTLYRNSMSSVLPSKDQVLSSNNHPVYITDDNQVIMRSVEGTDVDGLLSLLKSLHPHLVQRKDSLIPQYLGCIRLSVSSTAGGTETQQYFTLTRNPLSGTDSFFPIHCKYTLAGDGVTLTTGEDLFRRSSLKVVLKKSDADKLMDKLSHDLKFLSAHLLLNYKFAIGVHSIDIWEKHLEGETEDGEDPLEDSSLVHSITQQLEHLQTDGATAGPSTPHGILTGGDNISLVLDPLKHPFALPSPHVSEDSRAGSLLSFAETSLGRGNSTSPAIGAAAASSKQNKDGNRFIYFIGMEDLLPLSASYSSKEQNLTSKKHSHSTVSTPQGGNKENEGLSGGETAAAAIVPTAPSSKEPTAGGKDEDKKKAKDYAANILAHFSKLIVIHDE